MSGIKNEYEVEKDFIAQLEEQGYSFVRITNYDEVKVNFREQFCKLNSTALIKAKGTATLSDKEFERVLIHLDGHTIYESAKNLREKWVLELDNGKTVYVKFITPSAHKNTYQVAHQITMDKAHKNDVEYKNRYDVTLLINGLPLVQVELKRPGVELNKAINQINRYRTYSFKGLFRYIQIFVVSNSVQTKYFANVNERKKDGSEQFIQKSLTFYWTDRDNVRINRLEEFTADFLDRDNLTEVITKYMVIRESEPVVMVMRPYQIYAVKESVRRVIDSNSNGYVFHVMGSGKTLTSHRLATLFRDNPTIDKVFFLVDRKDLDDQAVEEYNSFEKGCVDNTDNTAALIRNLGNSEKKLIITTIQKMSNAIKNKKYGNVMALLADKRCVFVIDECHRSQFGTMHGDIKRHFRNSNYIGFTGTPIFEENKGSNCRTTADMFSSIIDIDSCIHRYTIKEAIADNNVLPFLVEYVHLVGMEGVVPPGIDPSKLDDPDYCKSKNIDANELYHKPKRIAEIAKHVLLTLESHTRPTGRDVYTAIFAVDKIQTLMNYYHILNENNDKGYKICAIFTYRPNEDLSEGQDEHSERYLQECMDDYNAMFGTSFDISTFDAYRKDVANRMKQKDLPQIDLLLVVDMFLTGFDSKVTNTLYLDKSLTYHSLVQAYSRTNRVDKPTKQFGQIITYRNIKKAQDAALRLFSGGGDPNAYLLGSFDSYKDEYHEYADVIREICPTSADCGNLIDEDKQKEFIVAFRGLTKALTTMMPFSDFNWGDLAPYMSEDEYAEYKSWYLTFFDEHKAKVRAGAKTILADIDFNIELVRTDKINVVYVLNLLKEINRKNKDEMQKSIDLILREIDHSDNAKMRYKADVMKSFIKFRFFELSPEDDIIKEYEQYEKEILGSEVNAFAKKHNIDSGLILNILNDYFIDKRSVTKNKIRESLACLQLPFKEKTVLTNAIMMFLEDMHDKFTNEGE